MTRQDDPVPTSEPSGVDRRRVVALSLIGVCLVGVLFVARLLSADEGSARRGVSTTSTVTVPLTLPGAIQPRDFGKPVAEVVAELRRVTDMPDTCARIRALTLLPVDGTRSTLGDWTVEWRATFARTQLEAPEVLRADLGLAGAPFLRFFAEVEGGLDPYSVDLSKQLAFTDPEKAGRTRVEAWMGVNCAPAR